MTVECNRWLVQRARARRLRWAAVACISSLCASCDPGFVRVQFEWPEGRPVFPEGSPASVFIRVEERADPRVVGPVLTQLPPYSFVATEGQIPAIPYGEHRVIVAELRESAKADAQVLYYGLSEPFTIEQGDHVEVPVFMQPRTPPIAVATTTTIAGSLRILTATVASGFVRSASVTLFVSTDSGIEVRLSNVLGLPEGKSETVSLGALPSADGAPQGQHGHVAAWNLMKAASPCFDPNFCPRQVYARFIDEAGYESRPVSADCVLDTQPPEVVAGATAIEPQVAKADSRISLSLTTSETLRGTPKVALEGPIDFPLVRLFPTEERRSNVFTFVASRPASVLGAGGTFVVRASLTDLAGNVAEDVEVGRFTLDTPAPGITGLSVEPPRVSGEPGRDVTIRFSLDDELTGGSLAVTIGQRPVDRCERSPELGGVGVTCTWTMRGDELPAGRESIEPVLVEAIDAAGNVARASSSVVYDFKPPALSSIAFSSEDVREGITAYLGVTTDERLVNGEPPVLVWAAGRDPGFRFFSTTGLSTNFGRPIDGSVPEGTYAVTEVLLTDLAGNRTRAVLPAPLTLRVDKTPPRLGGLVVSPARIGRSGRISARFNLSETPPSGGLAVAFAGRPMTCTSSGAAPRIQVSCGHVMTGDELPDGAEAAYAVVADAFDAAGNTDRASASLIVDFRAPELTDAIVSPAVARAGVRAILSLSTDETLLSGRPPVLRWQNGRSPGFAFASTLGLTHTFRLDVGVATPEGAFVLLGADLTDEAGNVKSGDLQVPLRFTIDRTPPAVTAFSVSPSHIGKTGVITARLTLGEALPASALSVNLGGRSFACTQSGRAPAVEVTCTRSQAGDEIPDDTEGALSVIADVVDAAGNNVRRSGSVFVDFRAPRLTDARVSPPLARAGIQAVLSLATDEALAAGQVPVLVFENHRNPGFTFSGNAGPSQLFTLAVGPSTPEGVYLLRGAVLEDRVQNRGQSLLPSPLRFEVDRTPPVVTGLSVSPERAGVNDTVTARFTLAEVPSSLSVALGGFEMTCTQSGRPPSIAVTCTFPRAAMSIPVDSEILEPISVAATDAAGNLGTPSTPRSVWLDRRPPHLVGRSGLLQIDPPAASLIGRVPTNSIPVTAAAIGSKIHVRFSLDEAAARAPSVSAVSVGRTQTLALVTTATGGRSFQYTYDLSSTRAQGLHSVEVTMEDRVGNRGTEILPLSPRGLEIDTVAPRAPDTNRFTHHRYPWGSRRAPQGPAGAIEASAGAAEARSWIVVLDRPSLIQGVVLTATPASAAGGLDRSWLAQGDDQPEVFVTVLDGAGNASSSAGGQVNVASKVLHGTWTASFRGKAAALALPNPHQATTLAWTQSTLAQDEAAGHEVDVSGYQALEASDDKKLEAATVLRWEERKVPTAGPPPRTRSAMAYDSVRGRAVLFGGSDASRQPLQDTWEWDGRRWFEMPVSGAQPSARGSAGMAFDAHRGKVVLFGGTDGIRVFNDTWEWDGQRWRLMAPSGPVPAARQEHALAYDGARGEVVLFGGRSGSTWLADGLWRWSGTAWIEVPRSTPMGLFGWPAARVGAAFCFDAARQALVLFGGSAGTTGALLSDLWSWSGSAWERVRLPQVIGGTPAPQARVGSACAYDLSRRVMVLFGGESPAGGPALQDLWHLGTSWNQVVPAAGTKAPAGLSWAPTAYDLRLGSVIVEGRRRGANGDVNETWTWEGDAWREVTPSTARPMARSEVAAAYDPRSRSVVMFGGSSGGAGKLDETWLWNGFRFEAHVKGSTEVGPSPRSGMAVAQTPSGLFFQGGRGASGLLSDGWFWTGTGWAYDAASEPETNPRPGVPPRIVPGAREHHVMAFDSTRQRVVLFGGTARIWSEAQFQWVEVLANDLLERFDTGWQARSGGGQPTDPGRRALAAMVYDPIRRQSLLFGGGTEVAPTLGDLQAWDGASWRALAPGSGPGIRQGHAMTVDEASGRALLFGGLAPGPQGGTPLDDLWVWTGSAWQRLAPASPTPGARRRHALVFDPRRKAAVLLAGSGADTNPWELQLDRTQRPGTVLAFDWVSAGVPEQGVTAATLELTAGGDGNQAALPESSQVGYAVDHWDSRAGAWSRLGSGATNSAAVGASLGATSMALSGGAMGPRLVAPDRKAHFIVKPLGGMGGSTARIALGSAELEVRYDLAR